MKIIFLDFDGVLNSQIWFKNANTVDRLSMLDESAIQLLNELIASTGAKVVVSSTWRLGRSAGELQKILDNVGFKGEVVGKTPDMRMGKHGDAILRGNEILAWIKENRELIGGKFYDEYREYVILDDDSDMLLWQRENYIYVDPYAGLSPNNVYKARRILNRG